MLLGAEYPLLEVMWTMLLFFVFIMWIFLVFRIIFDVFRRHDISGWGKAGWTALVVFLPFLGVLIYLIAHGGDMGEKRGAERDMRQVRQAQQADLDYVRPVAGSGGATAEIERAKKLLDNGDITQDEFNSLKAKALAS